MHAQLCVYIILLSETRLSDIFADIEKILAVTLIMRMLQR
jgi:hypothetical protein